MHGQLYHHGRRRRRGSVTNTATATGDSCNDGCNVTATAQATVTFLSQPSWTLAKSANPTTYSAAGQAIAYSYLLNNTGNVAIGSIAIADNKVASVSCPAAMLAPGATMTCTGSYTTSAADVAAGSVTDTATANGIPAAGALAPPTAQATITFLAQPSWTLSKTANPTQYRGCRARPSVTAYVLRNTGNVGITGISISDNKVALVSCSATTLAIGAQMTCTAPTPRLPPT